MSMNRIQIAAARKEAERFMQACTAALVQIDVEKREKAGRFREPYRGEPGDRSYGSAATGALRRSSMDLTRLLAELRKP